MRECVAYMYIYDPDSTLTFDIKVKFIDFFVSSCPTCNFCLLWHWHTIFGARLYHSNGMCCVQSWSWYKLIVKFIGFITWLCVWATTSTTYSYLVWNVSVLPWYDVSRTSMTFVWPWPLISISNFISSPWIWVWKDRLFHFDRVIQILE